MSDVITNQQLWGCTTFVNNVSDSVYVHLVQYLSLSETLLSKAEMEKIMAQSGLTVKHYHINNGRFSDNLFVDSINDKDHKLTFFRVGAHHQEGIIENMRKFFLQVLEHSSYTSA